jgi:hypothetical protein
MRLIPLLLLTACYGQEAWVDTLGASHCSRYRACYPDDFDELYEDNGECKDAWRGLWDDFDACLAEAGCAYDPKGAAACDKAIRGADCDSIGNGAWTDACTEIYTCDLGDSIAAGLCAIGF